MNLYVIYTTYYAEIVHAERDKIKIRLSTDTGSQIMGLRFEGRCRTDWATLTLSVSALIYTYKLNILLQINQPDKLTYM